MNSKERVLNSVKHTEPDRIPLFYRDVPEVDARLQADLGAGSRDALLEMLGIDFRWVAPRYTGPELELEGPAGPGLPAHRIRDIWNVEYEYKLFDGKNGYYEAVTHPLENCTGAAELEDYPWPDLGWFDFSSLKEQTRRYEEYAVMTAPGYASPGILLPIQNLLGETRAWTDIMINPEFFNALASRIMDFVVPFSREMLAAARGGIDFYRIGDDFGGQGGMLMSPELFRNAIKPHLIRFGEIAAEYGVRYYHHSCGSIRPVIGDLIEAGVSVLDPIQLTARDMEPEGLKNDFGSRLCFSGGLDELFILREGSPDDVRKEVRRVADIMAPGGGYFIGPTHNFQADIPTENITAMYEEAASYSGWKNKRK